MEGPPRQPVVRLRASFPTIPESRFPSTEHDVDAMALLGFEEARLRVGTLGIGTLLASAGGFLDGFTYVGHGHVFANAMTGNLVLLGIDCLSGSWRLALRHLPAILAFLVGVSVSQAIQLRSKLREVSAPYSAVLVLEISVLLIMGLMPATTADILFTTSIAFAASVQVQTFRDGRTALNKAQLSFALPQVRRRLDVISRSRAGPVRTSPRRLYQKRCSRGVHPPRAVL